MVGLKASHLLLQRKGLSISLDGFVFFCKSQYKYLYSHDDIDLISLNAGVMCW